MSKIRSLTVLGVFAAMTLGLAAPAFADRYRGWEGPRGDRSWRRAEEHPRWEERERREEREREWRRAEWYRHHHNIHYPGYYR